MRRAAKISLLLALLVGATEATFSQEKSFNIESEIAGGSLAEIRDKRRMLLLVGRSSTINTRDPAKSILADALKMRDQRRIGSISAYNVIGKKLNKYVAKYNSLDAVEQIEDADFVVVFNLLQMRWNVTRDRLYPYGEMFVFVNQTSGDINPRFIWRTKKNLVWAEDAINDFIRELKNVRGEK